MLEHEGKRTTTTHHVFDKWIEYQTTLDADLPPRAMSEARDAFYAGVIALMALCNEFPAKQDRDAIYDECGEFIREMEKKAEAPNEPPASQPEQKHPGSGVRRRKQDP